MEGDRKWERTCIISIAFQSTPSAWRETVTNPFLLAENVFQSTPSAWRETVSAKENQIFRVFQSTPSAWRETHVLPQLKPLLKHFNPLPPHGGRRNRISIIPPSVDISIHSLRMEGDSANILHDLFPAGISIHSLRMEGDFTFPADVPADEDFNPLPPHGGRHVYGDLGQEYQKFQSTPSAWRETAGNDDSVKFLNISIHSLRMEGDNCFQRKLFQKDISIHSLRMEGDFFHLYPPSSQEYFNPLPPHGGRPDAHGNNRRNRRYFNPLPPHGGRLKPPMFINFVMTFQSTPSAWRETNDLFENRRVGNISIHSLRMEGDSVYIIAHL